MGRIGRREKGAGCMVKKGTVCLRDQECRMLILRWREGVMVVFMSLSKREVELGHNGFRIILIGDILCRRGITMYCPGSVL